MYLTTLFAALTVVVQALEIASVTAPALLWASQNYVFENREVTDLTLFDEVMQRFQEGLETGQSFANHDGHLENCYLIIYPLPETMSSERFIGTQVKTGAGLQILSQGSFVFYPYTLRRAHSPTSEDWVEILYTLPVSDDVYAKRVAYLKPELTGDEIDSKYSITLKTEKTTTLDLIKNNLMGAHMIELQPRSDDVLEDITSFLADTAERVFVMIGTTRPAPFTMYPSILNATEPSKAPTYPVIQPKRMMDSPMVSSSVSVLHSVVEKQPLECTEDSDDEDVESKSLGDLPEKLPLVLMGQEMDVPLNPLDGAARRRLQAVDDEDVPMLRMKPIQMSMMLFLGAFIIILVIGVMCTAQITTPGLYLDKPQVINKEF